MSLQRYGLIGKKLEHSFSKKYFTEKFALHKIVASYDVFEIASDKDLAKFLLQTDAVGCNVTIPYKQSILQYIQEPDAIVKQCGATNCIRKIGPQRWSATNTDVIGFEKSLESLLQAQHKSAIVLGNGGAAQAVKFVLRKLNISYITVSRSILPGVISYHDVDFDYVQKHKLIINCTPLGMFPDIAVCPPIPYEAIGPEHLCMDLIYNPEQTIFLEKCKNNGAPVCNGLAMLHYQADAAYEYFGL